MTNVEKVNEIRRIYADHKRDPFGSEITKVPALREGLKVSDVFLAFDIDTVEDCVMYDILGYEVIYGMKRCEKIDAAEKAGFVKCWSRRKYGQFRFYYTLTATGRKALGWT